MSIFTPGPWHVNRKLVVGPRSDADDQSFGMIIGVCDVYGDNAQADARLIAAAPTMHRMLSALVPFMAESDTRTKVLALLVQIDGGRMVETT